MTTLSHGLIADLPADFRQRLDRRIPRDVQPPANGFVHDGRLNMGPAILLAVIVGCLGWSGMIGAGCVLYQLL